MIALMWQLCNGEGAVSHINLANLKEGTALSDETTDTTV